MIRGLVTAAIMAVIIISVIVISTGDTSDAKTILDTKIENPINIILNGSQSEIGSKSALDLERETEQYILKFTNDERSKRGLSPLIYDSQLSAIAKAHSVDMARNNFYSHTNLRGQDPTGRARAAGYSAAQNGWGIGENIHKVKLGINFSGKSNAEKLARKFVDDWMNSQGHRENILNRNTTYIGIGVCYDGNLWYYGTQNFC